MTDKGTIHAEHVVNAAGLWAREVAGDGRAATCRCTRLEHQYLVTEETPEIYERESEHPHVMDPSGESYLRQEGRGLCIGFYEKTCRPWAVDGTPWEFGHELLPDDFRQDRRFDRLCLQTLPGAGACGDQVGDPRPLHLRARWQPAGRAGAGAAQLLVGLRRHGGLQPGRRRGPEPCAMDGRRRAPSATVMALDVARFGRWIGPGYTLPKVDRELPDAVFRGSTRTRNCPPPAPTARRRCTTP